MKIIEATCRCFLWSGSAVITTRALVAWERICLPKEVGGLNLFDMKTWNQAAICKPMWALSNHKEKMWIKWLHTYYIKNQDFWTMETPNQAAWVMKKILYEKTLAYPR